jgi:hypothetical protein
MSNRTEIIPAQAIAPLIRSIRDQRVILDTDLARLYGVQTFRLNEAVKRNRDRFPADFLFQLTPLERDALTSQFAMSKAGRGGRRTLPFAFTEHGALMAATVLNSPRVWLSKKTPCLTASNQKRVRNSWLIPQPHFCSLLSAFPPSSRRPEVRGQ